MRHAETVTFGGSGLDRAAEIRSDIGALAEALQQEGAQTILIWRGKILVSGQDIVQLERLPMTHPALTGASGPPIFLGREDGVARWAHDISNWVPQDLDTEAMKVFLDPTEQVHPDIPGARFVELRSVMTQLSPRDAELTVTAKGLYAWHATHGFCARCGHQSDVHMAGWQRICPACGAHHFPRTDPVVIMLVTHGNRVLMGRSPGWPDGMYSCLAGFMEPGETMEAAVRREVLEEANIRVGAVRYLASQPWPFPASLMIGCHGEALNDDITVDTQELEDARWFTREEVMDIQAGLREDFRPLRPGAIAQFLVRNWLADTLD